MNKLFNRILYCSIIIYVFLFIFSLFIGRYYINIYDFVNANHTSLQLEINIILNLRLPRAIMSSLAGISLSLSGLIFQEIFQNDLVSPDLLGVSKGAGVGAAIGILFGLSSFFIITISLIIGIVTVVFTVLVSNLFNNKSNITLILSGIIVGSFMSSILTLIKYFADPQTQLSTIIYWLMGSFADVTYDNILIVFPVVLILFVVLLLISHRINLIALGKEETETKGINYIFYRNLIIIIATLLTAVIVANCGNISWVGLIIPHIVKSIVGRNVNKTLPLSAVFGAIFTIITDILSRSLIQSELPISAITGIIGSMVFTTIVINRSRSNNNSVISISKEIKRTNNDKYWITVDSLNNNCSYVAEDSKLIIKVNNLYYKYYNSNEYVLSNINLDIEKNKFVLLYGANGSGKTTLLKLIAGVLSATYGRVCLNTSNVKDESHFIYVSSIGLLERSKYISYVRQEFSNIGNILVYDYLLLGMVNELKFYQKPTTEQREKVERYASELNITRLLNKKLYEISGGEKQLVVICQSLLQNSNILLFDEPTSSLDSDNQELIINILQRLINEYNKTIIMSTHNKELSRIAGCIVKKLKNGTIE